MIPYQKTCVKHFFKKILLFFNVSLQFVRIIYYQCSRNSGELTMKLSTRTRYAMLAILELADHFGKGPLQTKVIAKTRIYFG